MLSTWEKTLEQYETFSEKLTNILQDGRSNGALCFCIAGDFNIELGVLCTGNVEDEELGGMYGPQCWQGYGADPGGFKKMMWYSVMKEFDCRPISTWSSCDDRNEMAFTHRQSGENGRTSKLDYRLGSRTDSSATYVHNGVKICSTWDHYPVCAVMRDRKDEAT